jgi:hypothetical protein
MKKSTIILLTDITLLAIIASFFITTALIGEYLILSLMAFLLIDVSRSYFNARTQYKLSSRTEKYAISSD